MPIILAQLVDLLPPIEFFYASWTTPALGFLVMWLLRRKIPPRPCWLLLVAYYLAVGLWLCGRSLPGPIGVLVNVCLELFAGPVVAAGFVVVGIHTRGAGIRNEA